MNAAEGHLSTNKPSNNGCHEQLACPGTGGQAASGTPEDRCQIVSNSPKETRAIGQALGARLTGGEVIALIGPLGAGKTELVKGLAAGNAQIDPALVTSPTFVLINEYPGPRPLYHLDAYRLRGGAELEALGFDELISPQSVAVIEWADRVQAALPEDRLAIHLEPTGDTSRTLTLCAAGRLSRRLLARFLADQRRSAGQR